MKSNLIFTIVLSAFIVSCHKPIDDQKPPQQPVTDKRTVLLKEVLIEHLPSPYFQFTYFDSFVTNISFASNLLAWDLQYENNRVKRMINTMNQDSLVYFYANERVATIRHIAAADGKPRWRYDFEYNGTGQLEEINWWAFPVPGSDSVLDRKVLLQYQPDGNLSKYDDYRRDLNGDFGLAITVELKDYDNGVNVDDFSLLKDFFDDLLFLPQVKLQKNNPRQLLWHGIDNDYTFTYSYQYGSNRLPLEKDYTILVNKGTNAGDQFTGQEQYLY
jgi:hypothetical protein